MEKFTSIIRDIHVRREMFGDMLNDAESIIMVAVSDHDDVLRDCDVDAIAQASAVASKLFTLAHDIALGLGTDNTAVHQQLQEVLAGVSVLADIAFAADDEDDEAFA